MRGLLLKDIFAMKKIYKQYIIMVIAICGLGIVQKNIVFFTTYATVMMMSITLSSFSYDEYSKWEEYAMALPVHRNDIIKSKYIIGVVGVATSMLISVIMLTIMFIIHGFEYEMIISSISSLCISAALFFTGLGILIPDVIKNGVEKSRIWIFVICFVFALIIMGVVTIGKISGIELAMNEEVFGFWFVTMVALLCVASVVIYFISYKASCKIFLKKRD